MLVELSVDNLGVIESARIPLGSGLVALTGETGAGKTMLIEALNLLAGHKADATRVRPGAAEASVEGLFVVGDQEHVLRRVVPAEGRSRAYVDGRLATVGMLSELAGTLLEIHGQHGQQDLFAPRAHRDALDAFGGVDTVELEDLRSRVRDVETRMATLDGDERERLREIDLIEYQLNEIDDVAPRVGEDDELGVEWELLSGALRFRETAMGAHDLLRGDEDGVEDRLAAAAAVLGGQIPFVELVRRLDGIRSEVADCITELRMLAESMESDPDRIDQVLHRRGAIADLRRKYGDTEAEVLEFAERSRNRLEELRSHERSLVGLGDELSALRKDLTLESEKVGSLRRSAAVLLGPLIEEKLADLALRSARLVVRVDDSVSLPGAGGSVEFLISTNPGIDPGPLNKVASGGELSRVMLALRLVLTESPPTMVFDEVDAGIGGRAATEVGRALARLAEDHQVLVVTHLPHVAAFADTQIRIEKSRGTDAVATTAVVLDHDDRVVELSRMLSGSPDSVNARRHAEELLAQGRRSTT